MRTLGVIPARYASTRFPGKPLVVIKGRSMIQRVYERASRAESLDELLVATDDLRIAGCVRAFGGRVEMTGSGCRTGTDRVAEVASRLDNFKIFVNIQGDEPLLEADLIDKAVELIKANPRAEITTLVRPSRSAEEVDNPHNVKAVLAHDGRVLYFSRSPVPYLDPSSEERKNLAESGFYHIHIGLYVYRKPSLARLCSLKPSELETAESLEQLRALQDGMSIYAATVGQTCSIGVDTPGDIRLVERLLEQMGMD